jgi:hypothetical protein
MMNAFDASSPGLPLSSSHGLWFLSSFPARCSLVLVALLSSCSQSGAQSSPGTVGGACRVDGTCDQGLVCSNNRCEPAEIGRPDAACADSQCVAPEPCHGVSCSGHGTCVVDGSQAKCQCASGYEVNGLSCVQSTCTPASHASFACDQDDVYWYDSCGTRESIKEDCSNGCSGNACNVTNDPCVGQTCSGHGSCANSGGTAACNCSSGYHAVGLTCVADTTDPCAGKTCSGHGSCANNGGTAACNCSSGYHAVGLTCVVNPVSNLCSGVTCSGHGTCTDNGGTSACICEGGYQAVGLTCATTTPTTGIVYVNGAYAGGAANGTLAQPYTTIQAGVNAAVTGNEIHVAGGTYTESVTIRTTAASSKHFKLLGGYASDFGSRDFSAHLTRIQSTSTANAAVSISSGQPPSGSAQFSSLIIEGFSISGGSRGIATDLQVNCWGAGCTSPLLALTVQSCILENNGSSTGGGGIVLGHGSQLLNSVVRNNKGDRGAGISGGGINVLIENTLIEDNLSYGDHGGGVYMSVNNPVTFRKNIVRRNVIGVGSSYGGWGGGVIFMGDSNDATSGEVVYMSGNVYTENMSGRGNVFIDEGATAYMDHERIYHNYTTGGYGGPATTSSGGAIYMDPGKIYMTNSTIVDNNHLGHLNGSTIVDDGVSASPTPNGLRITFDSTVDIRNSIFWGNGGDEFFISSSAAVTIAYSIVSNSNVSGGGALTVGTGTLVNVDPMFADLANGNLRLKSAVGRYSDATGAWVTDGVTSPAINAGDPASAYDLEPSPNGGRINMGYDGNTATASEGN